MDNIIEFAKRNINVYSDLINENARNGSVDGVMYWCGANDALKLSVSIFENCDKTLEEYVSDLKVAYKNACAEARFHTKDTKRYFDGVSVTYVTLIHLLGGQLS